MKLGAELLKLQCKVVDHEEARTATHQDVLLTLARLFDFSNVEIYCEPSVVGGRSGPPDILIIDPQSGVHVVEVKGIELGSVRAVKAGGDIDINYGSSASCKDPSRQARQAMFDLKDAASREFNAELQIGFHSWVVFPRIERHHWSSKFGDAIPGRSDVIFSDDLHAPHLKERVQRDGESRLAAFGLNQCPSLQLLSVKAALGDSAVLPDPRSGSRAPKGSKGEDLQDDLAELRCLTEQQQRLATQDWEDGPRLVRGVAGSGKTVVLATQAARMIERQRNAEADLFRGPAKPKRLLAVCFNRTLVPFIRQKISAAYAQRTGEALPKDHLLVTHFNGLIYELSLRGFCRYSAIRDYPEARERADRCLSDLDALTGDRKSSLDEGQFDSIFVDEGQDFHESEYKVLVKLCRRGETGHPRMFVFYDDAQNLYGLSRPKWVGLGLEIRGRSVIMDQCFRSTRQIIEPAFNVLIGTHSARPQSVKTRDFADIQTLTAKGHIRFEGRQIKVIFCSRDGDQASLHFHGSRHQQIEHIVKTCAMLIRKEGLLPQDILVVTFRRDRASEIVAALSSSLGAGSVHCPFEPENSENKDGLLMRPNKITVSTVASAKGYDAPYVIVASLEDFTSDVEGRASLYVACTRARKWLDVNASGSSELTLEFQEALKSTVSDVGPPRAGTGMPSTRTHSIGNRIASRISVPTSATMSPDATQPGRSGS